MPINVVGYDPTPNPNALKCRLDVAISKGPRSFLNAEMAAADPLAEALFEKASLTNLYINGDWMTISRKPGKAWPPIKIAIEQCLSEHFPT